MPKSPFENKNEVPLESSESHSRDPRSFQQVANVSVDNLGDPLPRQYSNTNGNFSESFKLDGHGFKLNAESNSHTPLLSTDVNEIPNNDLEYLSQLEDMNDSNSLEEENTIIGKGKKEVDSNQEVAIQETMMVEHIDLPPKQPTPFEMLTKFREEYNRIIVPEISHNMDFYYIDPEWYHMFLQGTFDPESFTLDKLGPIITKTDDYQLRKSDSAYFISFDQFKFLCDKFGVAENHIIINRRAVYSASNDKVILDLHPFHISPHIFCNNPSQINRYSSNSNKDTLIQFSTHSSTNDLIFTLINYFGLQNDVNNVRVWQIECDLMHVPTVIIPSTTKNIKAKKLLSKKKKRLSLLRSLRDKVVHLMLELRQPDNLYFLDIEQHILPGNGLVGLNNLGNTCYMNSALQCLMHIPELNSYFLYHYYEKELNKDNPLGNGGKVAIAFGNLIGNMFDNRYAGNQPSFSPRDFKYTIGHFNSLFADYHQQDSQEFIAYLLDGLHEDLNRVLKKPYVEKPELAEGKENDILAIRSLAEDCWNAHKLRNDSVIVDLFVAQYKSTLTCPICNGVSITFDPYNDLTLPLPIKTKWSHKIKILPKEGQPKVLEVMLPKTSVYYDLKNYVSKYTRIPVDELLGVEIHKNSIYKSYEESSSDARYLPLSELISTGDNVWFYQVENMKNHSVFPVFSVVSTEANHRNSFAIPFFISLSEDDRKSYGAIQRKMLQKYSQISSSSFFKMFETLERKKHTIEKFEGLEYLLKFADPSFSMKKVEAIDDDCSSIISYANPCFTVEEKFTTKVLDASQDTSYYNRFRYNRSNMSDRKDNNSLFWFPQNEHSIVQDNLPELRNKISLLKKLFYLYTPENAEFAKEGVQKMEQESTERETADSDVNMENAEELNDTVADQSEQTCGPSTNKSETPDSETYVTASETNDNPVSPEKFESAVLPNVENTNIDCKTEELESMTVSSSSSSASSSSSGPTDSNFFSASSFLVEPSVAFVNEFNEDSFNVLFCGTSDDEEFSGSEMWSQPELLVNDELEEERRLNLENANKPVTLYDCLDLFSQPEVLGQNDLWYCPKCKEHRQATKKIELWSAPDILTIHLKRFESTRSFSDKIDIVVDFPIEGLDLTKYVSDDDGEHIYDLFAVDNHFGGLGGGHYTAYVKNGKTWYYFDDSRVTLVNDPREAIKGSAYLLFYRKRSSKSLGGEFFEKMLNDVKLRFQELMKTIEACNDESSHLASPDNSGDEKENIAENDIEHAFEHEQNGQNLESEEDMCKRRKLTHIVQSGSESP